MEDTEQIGWNYVEGCITAYLRGKKTLPWIISIINGSDTRRLEKIIESTDGISQRKDELLRSIR